MSAELSPVPNAFLLGLEIEEVYAIFGESLQLRAGGALQPSHYEQIERKAQRVRDFLVELRCPFALVQGFEEAASRIYRAGDPRAADFDRVAAESRRTAHVLSTLMHEVRSHLDPDDSTLYDLGVMLARLHLCFRVLFPTGVTTPPELHSVYVKELARVVPLVQRFLAAGEQAVARSGSQQFAARLRSLAGHVEAWDGGSEHWCLTARERLERVFAAAGLLPRAPFDAASPVDEPAPDDLEAYVQAGIRAFEEARGNAQELFSARDFAAAERAQRALIEECRRRIGFSNPFTMSVRADLSFTLLALQQGDLAVDVVYDLSDDAERTFGKHHPNTARTHIHTLFVLMCTRTFEECVDFRITRLGWLDRADPATLDPELADVHRELRELTSGSSRR